MTLPVHSFQTIFTHISEEHFESADVSPNFVNELVEAKLLNEEQANEVLAADCENTPRWKKIISFLQSTDNSKFDKFFEALKRAGYSHVVNHIDFTGLRSCLTELLQPEFGLLTRLQSSLLTALQAENIKSEKMRSKQNERLLDELKLKIFDEPFLNALKLTGQLHIANYIQWRGVKCAECGNDWPLDDERFDRLKNSMADLAELIDQKAGVISHMTAARCITDWERQHIEAVPVSAAESNERLLRLMMCKSVAQYEKFIECLENTHHGENVTLLLKQNTANASTDAVLEPPAEGTRDELEHKIISQFKQLVPGPHVQGAVQQTQDETIIALSELRRILSNVGLDISKLELRKQNSIGSYILCKTLEQLERVRSLYESGRLKSVLEDVFTLLAGTGKKVRIFQLKWPEDSYQRCRKIFQRVAEVVPDVASLFDKLPLEMLEELLVKTTQTMFTAISHEMSVADKETLLSMASVCRTWWLSIVNRQFNKRRMRKQFTKLCQPYLMKPHEYDRIPTPAPVYGIAQIKSHIYVTCYNSSCISVYGQKPALSGQAPKYKLLKDVNFELGIVPADLVACHVSNQLYVADSRQHCVWRVSERSILEYVECAVQPQPVKMMISRAEAGGSTRQAISSLSVTAGRLLILSPNKLSVFAAPGTFELEMEADKPNEPEDAADLLEKLVKLPEHMNAWHAVETLRNTYLVCHIGWDDALHDQVSELDAGGRVLRAYGGQRGPGAGQLDMPWYMLVDSDIDVVEQLSRPGDGMDVDEDYSARVMVADTNNRRVVLLDAATLTLRRVLVQTGDDEGAEPWRICYDGRTGLLAVGLLNGVVFYRVGDSTRTGV